MRDEHTVRTLPLTVQHERAVIFRRNHASNTHTFEWKNINVHSFDITSQDGSERAQTEQFADMGGL
jgi:hypothetical protein